MEVLNRPDADVAQSRVAGSLRRAGLRRGDRLGLCVPSSAAFLNVLGGALRTGIVPVVVNSQLLTPERQVICDDAEVALWIDDLEALDRLLDGPRDELAPNPLARPMYYTSGTTGRPKGVWSGVLDERDALALWNEEIEEWSLGADDIHLVCSPLQHSAPIRLALSTLLAGGRVVIPGPFTVGTVVDAVQRWAPTTTFCTPAHLQRLDEHHQLEAWSRMRLVLHAGAACPDALKRRAIEAIGVDRLWEFYGSTEGQFTVCSSSEWLERPGTVGRARRNRSLQVDGDAMVWCTAPAWGRWTYWRDPKRTSLAWRGHSFSVGDLGRLDQDGYLFLDGRRSDLIITGGINVYPVEIEHVLRTMPGIEDVVVFGRNDERWGQRVCAAVVGDVSERDVLTYAAKRLAPFKVPKEVDQVAEIPRIGLDKVHRSSVADLFSNDPAGRQNPT